MTSPSPLPVRALRISLILGAFVDLTGAVPLLLFPEATARWIGAPVDGVLLFWPSYTSVFLFVLPIVYCITALNPVRNLALVAAAIAGRAIGAVAYFCWWTPLGRSPSILGLSVMNLAFAVFYFAVLGKSGRADLRDALRPASL